MQHRRGETSLRLINADFNYALRSIQAGTVDAIITDPPWEHAALSFYKPLARHACRLLKRHGNLVIVTGGLYDQEIISAVSEYLPLYWRFVFNLRGSDLILPHKGVYVDHRMAYWFRQQGAPPLPRRRAIRTAFDLLGKDKAHHDWGQPVDLFQKIMLQICYRGAVIVDPFLGGGACGEAAVNFGASAFVGIEKSEEAFLKCQTRLKGEKPHESKYRKGFGSGQWLEA